MGERDDRRAVGEVVGSSMLVERVSTAMQRPANAATATPISIAVVEGHERPAKRRR